MKVRPSNKPYSWLQWPVTLLNCKDPHPHITAKFFGSAAIDPFAIEDLCDNDQYLPRRNFHWVPVVFEEKFVLEFIAYPAGLKYVHDVFGIIQDQFPTWRPHVTVSHDYWKFIVSTQRTAYEEEITLGEMELFLRNDLLGVYGTKMEKSQ